MLALHVTDRIRPSGFEHRGGSARRRISTIVEPDRRQLDGGFSILMQKQLVLADLRAAYSPKKRARESKFLWVSLLRPLSFHAAWLFLKLGITANQITWLSMILGLGGCLLVAVGHGVYLMVGVLLVNLWFFFDCVDGNVARHTRSAGEYGEFIDDLGGYLMMAGLFMSVGIGLYRHPTGIVGPELDPGVYLVAGGLGSLAAALNKQISFKFQILFGSSKPALSNEKPAGSNPLARLVWKNLIGFSGLVLPLFTIAAVLGGRDFFVLFYGAAHVANCVSTTGRCISKARKRSAPA